MIKSDSQGPRPDRVFASVRVSEEIFAHVAQVAKQRGVSIFTVAEEAIDACLTEEGAPKKKRPGPTGRSQDSLRNHQPPVRNTQAVTPQVAVAPKLSKPDAMVHIGLIADIMRRLRIAELDVVRVIDQVLLRLEKGRAYYGDLRLDTDKRDFKKEAAEELWDLMAYLAIDAVQAKAKQLAAIEAMPDDEVKA